ncbi:MAG: hypothetical protein L3K03_06850 [Thermoplasmata archaeon]|nr:hypothetical protein [Thermoplasmata archaeon]
MSSSVDAGLARLRSLSLSLPEQLLGGYAQGARIARCVRPALDRAVLVGMGGSAVAGDLAQGLTDAETRLTLEVVRSPVLPPRVRKGALLIAASYSGGTWETLAAYDEGGRRGIDRVVIAAGGPLAENARRDGVPCIDVPPGGPPRAWVGFTLGGLLGILDPSFPRSNASRVRAAAELVTDRATRDLRSTGAPARWARTIGPRPVAIYADVGFAGLARRWKTSVEENAKRPAEFDLLPEMFHNALVAWDRRAASERRGVVLLSWSGDDATVSSRRKYLEQLLRRRRVPVVHVALRERDRLAATLEGILLGDFFSLALADDSRIDPYPIVAIERMKATLERPSAKPARRGPRKARAVARSTARTPKPVRA